MLSFASSPATSRNSRISLRDSIGRLQIALRGVELELTLALLAPDDEDDELHPQPSPNPAPAPATPPPPAPGAPPSSPTRFPTDTIHMLMHWYEAFFRATHARLSCARSTTSSIFDWYLWKVPLKRMSEWSVSSGAWNVGSKAGGAAAPAPPDEDEEEDDEEPAGSILKFCICFS